MTFVNFSVKKQQKALWLENYTKIQINPIIKTSKSDSGTDFLDSVCSSQDRASNIVHEFSENQRAPVHGFHLTVTIFAQEKAMESVDVQCASKMNDHVKDPSSNPSCDSATLPQTNFDDESTMYLRLVQDVKTDACHQAKIDLCKKCVKSRHFNFLRPVSSSLYRLDDLFYDRLMTRWLRPYWDVGEILRKEMMERCAIECSNMCWNLPHDFWESHYILCDYIIGENHKKDNSDENNKILQSGSFKNKNKMCFACEKSFLLSTLDTDDASITIENNEKSVMVEKTSDRIEFIINNQESVVDFGAIYEGFLPQIAQYQSLITFDYLSIKDVYKGAHYFNVNRISRVSNNFSNNEDVLSENNDNMCSENIYKNDYILMDNIEDNIVDERKNVVIDENSVISNESDETNIIDENILGRWIEEMRWDDKGMAGDRSGDETVIGDRSVDETIIGDSDETIISDEAVIGDDIHDISDDEQMIDKICVEYDWTEDIIDNKIQDSNDEKCFNTHIINNIRPFRSIKDETFLINIDIHDVIKALHEVSDFIKNNKKKCKYNK
eukprot:GHVL01020830.1.p1 GENE.GHVL01020830.1~~GHVL01020830.1.p1  ORF type:complete len:553 (-),score=147.16 GHVL01020830.1:363-2021(-)